MRNDSPGRRFPVLGLALLLGMALAACAPVSHQRDETIPIPPGATVALGGVKWEITGDLDPAFEDDSVHLRIQDAIAGELRSRGYTWTGRQADSADFLLRYFVAQRREVQPAATSGAPGPRAPTPLAGWGWGWSGGTVTPVTPRDFASDAFVVELLESSTGTVAWRAVWRGDPPKQAPSRQELDRKMEKIFRSLPPASD